MKLKTANSVEQKEFRASNKQELEAICVWINDHINDHIGWDELSHHTKRSHKELIELFRQINTTPMAYIRYIKETLKIKEDIKTKTSKIIRDIQSTDTDQGLIKRTKLITQNGITEQSVTTPLYQSKGGEQSIKSIESQDITSNAKKIYQSRKQEIIHEIQLMDDKTNVTIDNDVDLHDSNSHIIKLHKNQEIRTVGLSKDEFYNVGDQFTISALLRIMTAMNEMRP